MAAPQHLQFINSAHFRSGDRSFTCFPLLFPELRACIWQLSLERHRWLEIQVDTLHIPTTPGASSTSSPDSQNNAKPSTYSSADQISNSTLDGIYETTVQGRQIHSKLLRVSREARQAAQRFYRVHIPCQFKLRNCNDGVATVRGILYLNPEHDFIRITASDQTGHTLANFLHDLKAHDPRGIGLANLALDANDMQPFRFMERISFEHVKASFVSTLSNLKNLVWVAHSACGRAILGPMQDFRDAGIRFNHSMPVKAAVPYFELLTRDPRPVELDLQFVLTAWSDPRQMRVHWQQVLERWNITQAQPTRERVLFACEPLPHEQQIEDGETATSFLVDEEEAWKTTRRKLRSRVSRPPWNRLPIQEEEGPDELAKAVRPAIGFWMFEAEALGPLDEDKEFWRMKNLFDMRGHWPELALAYLPDDVRYHGVA